MSQNSMCRGGAEFADRIPPLRTRNRNRNRAGALALAVPLVVALASDLGRAAERDHDGRWRLEYSCARNTANGAAPYVARVDLAVEVGAVAARTAARNERLNRHESEQWSGRFDGSALAMKTIGSASDGASWEFEWTGTAASSAEGSVTGLLFAPVRGVRTQVRVCEGRMTLLEPASSQTPPSVSAAPARPQQVAPRPALASDPGFRRAELRWFRNGLAEANADQRELDILLLLRSAGSSAVQRNMDGAFVLSGGGAVCVDARELMQGDARIPLARLAPGPKVARGTIGIAELRPLDQNTARAVGMRMPGWGPPIVIGKVVPGSPAEQAGLSDGDIVLTIDGTNTHAGSFAGIFADSLPGRVMRLQVWRVYAPGDPEAPTRTAPIVQNRGAGRASEEPPPVGRAITLEVKLGERMVDMPNAPAQLAVAELYRALRLSPPRFHAPEEEGGGDLVAADKALHEDFPADMAAAAAALLRRVLGARAETVMAGAGGACWKAGIGNFDRSALLLPRMRAEAQGMDLRDWTLAGTLSLAGLRAVRAARLQALERDRAAREELVRALAGSAPSGEGALYGALWVGERSSSPAPCVVEATDAHAPRLGMRVEHVLRSEAFRSAWPGTPRQARRFDSVEALFQHIKSRDNRCEVVPGSGPTLVALQAALARDGVGAELLPVRVDEEQLAALHAGALGFRALGARSAVDAWLFALEIGGLSPRHVEALFALGVDKPDAVGEAVLRHEEEHGLGPIQEDADALLAFLLDEQEARRRGTTIRRLRAEREAAALRAAADAEAARREQERRRAAEFPFVAEFTCSIGQNRTSLQACLHAGGIGTEIELRNGGDHRVFKLHDVAQMGEWNGGAMLVELRRSFAIKAQNADETLVLGLVVRERGSGAVRYQRQAGRYGVLQVSN